MAERPQRIACFEVTPQYAVHFTNCAVREPTAEPFAMERRVKECFVALAVLRGQIHLIEFHAPEPERVTVKMGELHAIAPGTPYATAEPFAVGTKTLSLHFSFFGLPQIRHLGPDRAGEVLYGSGGGPSPGPRWIVPRHLALGSDVDGFARAHGELRDHARLWGTDDMGCHEICGYLVSMMHRAFVRRGLVADEAVAASPASARVARARSYIRLNFERKVSLARVAEAAGLNPSYLSRCFRKVTGERMVDFLLRTRIDAAKALLSDAGEPHTVKEVAYQTGFSSPAHFCRAFRRLVHKTALAYAEAARRSAGARG